MTELLIWVISYLFSTWLIHKPIHVQDWPMCTVSAMYECWKLNEANVIDPYVMRSQRRWVSHTKDVLARAYKKGWITYRMYNKRDWLKKLKEWKPIVIDIWYRDETDKYFITRWKQPWHTVCWVGTIQYNKKDWIIVRNTRGESNWILWYYLVDPKVVTLYAEIK